MGGAELQPQDVTLDNNESLINIEENDFQIDKNDAEKLQNFLDNLNLEEKQDNAEWPIKAPNLSPVINEIDSQVEKWALHDSIPNILEWVFNYLVSQQILNPKGEVLDINIQDQTKEKAQIFLTMLQKLQEYDLTDTENSFDQYQAELTIDKPWAWIVKVEVWFTGMISHLESIVWKNNEEPNEDIEPNEEEIVEDITIDKGQEQGPKTALITFLEDITDGNIGSKSIELFEQNTEIIKNLTAADLQNEQFKNSIKNYLDIDTNTIEIVQISSSWTEKYPKGTTYLEVTDEEGNIHEIIPWPQAEVNLQIIKHLTKTNKTQLLADHLISIQEDLSNRWKTAPDQFKNIQQTLQVYLTEQDRAKTYLTHIDNDQARKDNLNTITDPEHKSILESYTKIYDTLKEELQPKKPTLQDQVKNVTEQVEKQANEFREKRWDVIVQAADFFFGGKDGLLATLDERWIKVPRLTDKIKEQYQKEFAFSSDQQETFTKIVEWLPQDWEDNPFTQPFSTPKEAINKFFETNTQTEYLKVAKEQYENFSPKAIQQLIALYNKGNPNNTVEVKNFIDLNNKNEPTGIKGDSREQFQDILSSKTTQNLITQADQQINWYQKVGENYIYNMNPENFWSATDKNINSAKDVAQYMTAFLVAWDKDFKYVITENSLIDTNDQKEAQENPEEEFTKNLEELTKNIDDATINKADGYEYSNENDYQANILEPMSNLFTEDNYESLIEEIKKDPSTIKERLQKPINLQNLYIFENQIEDRNSDDETLWALKALTKPQITMSDDEKTIIAKENDNLQFQLNLTKDDKKIITKIEDTNA